MVDELTDEAREFCVGALTSTTRKQCRHRAGLDQHRCALAVIAEAGGHAVKNVTGHYPCEVYSISGEGSWFLAELIPPELLGFIPEWNDCGDSFDTIAKKIKDWEG